MTSRRLFFRNSAPSGPKGHRAYAVGDVHGCLDLLDRLLARIEQEVAQAPRRKTSLVFLGDLIDRGPASAQVVDRLRCYSAPGVSTHFIMGNHEEVMLRILAGEAHLLPSWLKFGGAETLKSYGVEPRAIARMPPSKVAAELNRAIPGEHVRFLEGFADSISFGDYLFVHAGIRPGVELSQQSRTDLRWIREPFLDDTSDHGLVVVHGHTISNSVEVTTNRIGIDTGAYSTGTLSALAIDGAKRWLIQTSEDETVRLSLGE